MNKKLINFIIAFSILLIIVAIPVQATNINNPLTVDSPQELVGVIIKALLGLTGTISLIYFIIGGFMWMTAGGNKDNVQKGKNTLVWATLGLVIIFSAYSILTFVFDILPTN
ncbi:TrbC/VirB2 family protein [Patescibacteria group bacterium]|nr:TrbC/VirB2 family protein [Patescibacteria group bacterium]